MPPPAPNPLFLFPQEKMHGIRMQSKGKGKKGDCSIGLAICWIIQRVWCLRPPPLGETRVTVCLGPCWNFEPCLHPRSSGRDLISQAGRGSWVSHSLESIQILAPEDGVLSTLEMTLVLA